MTEGTKEIRADQALGGLSADELRHGYRSMVRAREVEARGWDLVRQNRIYFAINSAGHEGVAAGYALAMRRGTDHWATHYRDTAGLLVLGVTPLQLLSTMYARAEGLGRGRQPPGYWVSAEHRVLSGTGPQPNHLLHAVGAAMAAKRFDTDEVAWAGFGDGGASRGEFHEGLNFAAIHRLPVVFVCHNNGYTQSVALEQQSALPDIARHAQGYGIPGVIVDGMDLLAVHGAAREARERAAAGEGPTLIEAKTYRFFANTSNDDERRYRSPEEVEAARERDPIPALAARLVSAGVLDEAAVERIGNEVAAEVDEAAERAGELPLPDPSEATRWTYAGEEESSPAGGEEDRPRRRRTATPGGAQEEVAEASMVEGVRLGLRTALAEDERVLLLGEDVGPLGGVFRASDGLLEEFGPERVVDTPMAELSIVGISVGMALRGLRPVAEIQFADFIYAAADQIISEAARYRFRTAGAWEVPMVIRAPWGGGIHGALYHSQSIEAVFAHFPGLKVVASSTPSDAAGLLLAAIDDPDPVIVLEHKLAYRRSRGELSDPPERVEIGPARVAREGSEATVFAYGWMVHEALEAAERLASEGGPDLEVVDLRTLLPLDREAIAASASKTGRACVVHEDMRTVGMGAEVSATITERCFGELAAPVARVTMPDVAGTPYADGLEAALIPDAERIAAAVRELAASRPRAPRRSVAPDPGPRRSVAPRGELRREDEAGGPRREGEVSVPQASMTMTAALDDLDRDADPTALIVAATAQALVEEPEGNGLFAEDGIHLNPAVDLELIEPGDGGTRRIVIPRAEELSPVGIERRLDRARAGREPPPETSPTATLVVPGGAALLGVPCVPPGQTAAIQAGVVHDGVVATERGIEVRRQLHLTLSADHRVLDGAGSARLLAAIKRNLEGSGR